MGHHLYIFSPPFWIVNYVSSQNTEHSHHPPFFPAPVSLVLPQALPREPLVYLMSLYLLTVVHPMNGSRQKANLSRAAPVLTWRCLSSAKLYDTLTFPSPAMKSLSGCWAMCTCSAADVTLHHGRAFELLQGLGGGRNIPKQDLGGHDFIYLGHVLRSEIAGSHGREYLTSQETSLELLNGRFSWRSLSLGNMVTGPRHQEPPHSPKGESFLLSSSMPKATGA